MKINLKCFADLAKKYTCRYDANTEMVMADNAKVDNVMRAYGMQEDEVKIILVNGKISERAHRLSDGDNVALVPATGGM